MRRGIPFHQLNHRTIGDPPLDPPEPDEPPECPECGDAMDSDRRERWVECPACGYSNAFDWDAEAERRAEHAAFDDPGRDVW